MDLASFIERKYASTLSKLAQVANQLSRARGNQKRQLEQEFRQAVTQLLASVQNDFPSRLTQNFVLTVLYQTSELANQIVANALRAAWQHSVIQQQTEDSLANQINAWSIHGLLQASGQLVPTLNFLPQGSWFLQFDFTLAKPYISHDDTPSYIIDNPVSTDRVLGLPLIRPSSWKGNLRSALRQLKVWTDDQPELARLFGNPKGAEDDFRSGRLECYPTFFYRVGLEIINPHDRTRRVGKNPILFECVPAGTTGTFSLLYVPFDLIGQATAEEITRRAKDDLQLVAEAISALMLTYGFSAKRTSGYGVAKDEIQGKVQTRAGEKSLKSLRQLAQEVKDVAF